MHLRSLVELPLKQAIALCHYIKSDDHRTRAMNDFKGGKIRILLASGAAGMGCDILDVIRVVQYGMPKDLVTLIQHLRRTARIPTLKGQGISLISPNSMLSGAEKNLLDYVRA
ncbi:ATP-dependent DNA helicase sgs1 [Mortierella sp. AD010]|nr:ATP-dependent DNA helicase sgs1 [Mortierella sp. AD010]